MQTTSNYGLKKPENTDPVNIQDFNDNADVIDAALKKKLESGGNASDMTTTFSQASSRTNLVSEEAVKTSFGKIMKWFADLKGAAFAAIANNLTTNTAGSVLDATQGKVLDDKITVINSSLEWVDIDTSGWALAYVQTLNLAKYNPATKEVWIQYTANAMPNDSTSISNIQTIYRPSTPVTAYMSAIGYWVTPVTVSSIPFRASSNIQSNGKINILYPVNVTGYHIVVNIRYIAN